MNQIKAHVQQNQPPSSTSSTSSSAAYAIINSNGSDIQYMYDLLARYLATTIHCARYEYHQKTPTSSAGLNLRSIHIYHHRPDLVADNTETEVNLSLIILGNLFFCCAGDCITQVYAVMYDDMHVGIGE